MANKSLNSNNAAREGCWFPFLSFSIGWTVFIPGPKKRKQVERKMRTIIEELLLPSSSITLSQCLIFESETNKKHEGRKEENKTNIQQQ
jgi:hypothetical protein